MHQLRKFEDLPVSLSLATHESGPRENFRTHFSNVLISDESRNLKPRQPAPNKISTLWVSLSFSLPLSFSFFRINAVLMIFFNGSKPVEVASLLFYTYICTFVLLFLVFSFSDGRPISTMQLRKLNLRRVLPSSERGTFLLRWSTTCLRLALFLSSQPKIYRRRGNLKTK